MEGGKREKGSLQVVNVNDQWDSLQVLPGGHRRSGPYSFRMWPDKVQALVTYDTMRLNDPTLPWTVRNGRYMPVGLHTPRLTVVAVKVNPAFPPPLPCESFSL